MELSVHCPSPLNTFSYVGEENMGSIRKYVENYLLFPCITNLILALSMYTCKAWMGWMENLSKTVGKKFLQLMHSAC
jgi:hypothetical protein